MRGGQVAIRGTQVRTLDGLYILYTSPVKLFAVVLIPPNKKILDAAQRSSNGI